MSNPLASELDGAVAQAEDVWAALRRGRVFMTGGTGFFGCWLLEAFLWANDTRHLGASAVVLTRDRAGFARKAPHLASHPAVTLLDGDVRTFAFPEGAFSHVVHAAADSSTSLDTRDPSLMLETLVCGTRRVLELARRSGARRFLLASSGAVYGRQPPSVTHVSEDFRGGPDPADSRHVYGEGKRAAEMLCAVHAGRDLEPTIARGFAFVGPHLPIDAHFAIGNFVRDTLNGGPIRVLGDGTPLRSYLYAADLAIWMWTILVKGTAMRPYNVGSDEDMTVEQVARRFGDLYSVPVSIARAPVPGAAAERYVPSIARARTELGLRVSVPLDEAIRRTMRWHTLQLQKDRT